MAGDNEERALELASAQGNELVGLRAEAKRLALDNCELNEALSASQVAHDTLKARVRELEAALKRALPTLLRHEFSKNVDWGWICPFCKRVKPHHDPTCEWGAAIAALCAALKGEDE